MTPQAARREGASAAGDAAEFSFSTAGFYADKDEYLSKGLVFSITAVEFQESAGFEGTDRWAVGVSVSDGRPDEIITLQSNEGRDAELEAAAAHIAKHGPIRNTQLVKRGKAFYFRKVVETGQP